MPLVVRVLHLEDCPIDLELIPATLEAGGFQVESRPARSREEYLTALDEGGFDAILADCNLPAFNGHEALALACERRPEVPFLFVSGFIGEEAALESLKNGAMDYVFKQNLARLSPAVRRALKEARDQRERRQSEIALQEREATLASFFDASPFMMGVVELAPGDLVLLSVNAAASRFFGRPAAALIRCGISQLGFPRELIHRWSAQCREAQRLRRPVEAEHSVPREGRTHWISSTVNMLPSEPAAAPRLCFVAMDITEKKQLEQQYLRAQRLESVGTLASGIAHDLNNVLAPIVMSLRLFRAKLPDAEDQEVIASMESSTQRGAAIIRQVLTFARGADGARQPISVGVLMIDLVKILRDTFPRSIQIESDGLSDLLMVNGDATQLYQVLMNLCVNARDAMPEGGRLGLSLRNVSLGPEAARLHADARGGDYVQVGVKDSGTGIHPEILDKIFDPFFTTKDTSVGTGLGLSMVLTIVKSHGGFITVTSPPGLGAEFNLYLPAHHAPIIAPPAEVPADPPRGNNELILVVDDEAAVRLILCPVLINHGYRVVATADGTEAIALFEQQGERIDLVITDLMMPGLDGVVLVRSLRARRPNLKIIIMSGLSQVSELSGASFLQKPFTSESLLQAVHDVMHGAPASGGG